MQLVCNLHAVCMKSVCFLYTINVHARAFAPRPHSNRARTRTVPLCCKNEILGRFPPISPRVMPCPLDHGTFLRICADRICALQRIAQQENPPTLDRANAGSRPSPPKVQESVFLRVCSGAFGGEASVRSLHAVCMQCLYAICMQSVCNLYMQSVYSLYAICMQSVCSL